MKVEFWRRLLTPILVVALACEVAAQTAPDHHETLPNFDKRLDAEAAIIQIQPPRAAAARPDAGLDALREVVPTVRVDRDPILGSAAFVAARDGFLTGEGGRAGTAALVAPSPVTPDPYESVMTFVDQYASVFGHNSDALEAAAVRRDYITPHNRMRTVIWQQVLDGIEVFEGTFHAHLTSNSELVNAASRLLSDPPSAVQRTEAARVALISAPPVSAPDAIAIAARNLGETVTTDAVVPQTLPEGAERRQAFRAPALSDAEARLVWLPMDESTLRLAWEVICTSKSRGEMYRLLVDAETAEPLIRHTLTSYISDASYRVFNGDSPAPFSPGHATPLAAQPSPVDRVLITTSALDVAASPNGWIDDGVMETRGNNVDAHTDVNADNQADTPRPQATGGNRVFDPPMDFSQGPSSYRDAAVVNLFYWNNWVHDQLYALGFTEAAGNFQDDNFGRGGLGNDAVQADAQDGGGTNNANFSTPPDGYPGRMQMYVFTAPNPDRDGDFDSQIIVHEYVHGLSNRLVGGGVGISAMQSRGMGEGWSDFYSLAMLSEASDDLPGTYAAGAWAVHQFGGQAANYYFGIRRYPYSTDLSKNPLTFRDIDPLQASQHAGIPRNTIFSNTATEVHNMGEVWCVTLWDARANLIAKHGFNVGNQLILQLVTDGMKLAPANPNFLQARDAILQADMVNTGGANRVELWAAFAKRGMGASATSPPSYTSTGLVESFEVPDDLGVGPSEPIRFVGPIGGPFKPTSSNYTLINSGDAPIVWTAEENVSWFDVSSSGGSLPSGDSVTVAATLNTAAAALAPGTYSGTITFRNTTSGVPQARIVQIEVEPFTVPLLTEDFESGTLDSTRWSVTGTGSFRTQVTTANGPHGGTRHLTLDSGLDGTAVRNEVTLTMNLAGERSLVLKFWAKLFSDEPHGPPATPFVNGADFDGVAISEDGVNWYEVQSLRAPTASDTWAQFTVDLDAAIATLGLKYTSTFKIRFNQFDDFSIPSDGIAIDDVLVARVLNNRLTLTGPASVAENNSPVSVTLTAIPSPAADLVVALVATEGAPVTLPATATIPAGQATTSFNLTPVDDAQLNGSRSVTLSATAGSWASGTAKVVVHDNETAALTVELPTSIAEGTADVTGTVAVNAVPDAAIIIQLTSDDATTVQTPATLVLPAGNTSGSFNLIVPDDSRINGTRTARITASVMNWTAGEATIDVLDNENTALTFTLPALIREGDTDLSGSVGISGTLPNALTITLASTDADELAVPSTVTIPAGQRSATFGLTIGNDALTDGGQTVQLTASATGFTSATSTPTVADNDVHHFTLSTVVTPQVRGAPFMLEVVARDVNGDLITNYDAPVTLSATAGATTVGVTPGELSTFEAGTWNGMVTVSDFAADIVLTVSDGAAHFGSSNAFDAGIGELDHFSWDAISDPQNIDVPFAVTLTAQDAGNNRTPFTGTVDLELIRPAGGPSIATGTQTSYFPLYTYTHDARTQVLYHASELGGPQRFTGLQLYVATIGGGTMNNWTIRVKHTSMIETTQWDSAEWTVVHQATLAAPLATGWLTFDFSTPFDYDGTSNLLVDFSFNNTAGTNSTAQCRTTPTNRYRTVYAYSDSQHGDPLTWTNSSGPYRNYTSSVPNIKWVAATPPVPLRPSLSANFTDGSWTGDVSVPVTGIGARLSARASSGSGASGMGLSNVVDFVPATLPSTGGPVVFVENFETGAFSSAWTVTGTGSRNTQITTDFTPRGARHMTMDANTWGVATRNEATLTLDLANRTGVVLKFWAKEFNDEPHGPPAAPFPSGGADFDGVAISADGGANWYEVHPLRSLSGSYAQQVVDLDAAIAARGLSYSSSFKIRFNQFDYYPIYSRGIAIDDILVTAAAVGPPIALTLPLQGVEGSSNLTGTVTLPATVTADVVVALSSSAPAKLYVPASVTVPAGQTAATFSFNLPDDLIDGARSVAVTASAAGYESGRATVSVLDNDTAALALAVPATALETDGSKTATLTVGSPPAGALTVNLSSSDLASATVPATVTFPPGQTTLTFPITINNDNVIGGARIVTFTASVPNWTPATATIALEDDEAATLTVLLPPSLREGDAPKSASVRLTGILPGPLTVSLGSSDTSEATVPASVIIPAGQTFANFNITTVNDAEADGPQTATITAAASGFSSGSASQSVRDNDAHHFSFVTIAGTQVTNGPVPAILTARDAADAPITDYNSTVTLTAASGGNPLTISPATASGFVNGVWNGSVQINAVANNVVITASDGQGHTGASNAFNLVAGAVDRFVWDTIPSPQLLDTPLNVSLRAVNASGNTATSYNGIATLAFLYPTTDAPVGGQDYDWLSGLYTYYPDSRSQFIYLATELGGATRITALAINIKYVPNETLTNFTIRLKPTSLSSFSGTAAWDSSGWTTVYRASPILTTAGWVTFTFTTPFDYDGVSNLMVDWSMDRTAQTYNYVWVQAGNTSSPMALIGSSNNSHGDPLTWTGQTPYPNQNWARPAIAFSTVKELPARPRQTGAFVNGVWSGQVSLPISATGLALRARAGSALAGTSNTFDVGLPVIAPDGGTTVFSDNFESGGWRTEWTVTGTGPYRTRLATDNGPHGGSRHLTMDSSSYVSYARNEATLTLNLAGRSGVRLGFWAREFNDVAHGPPPSPFPSTGADFDGVAISADGGANWYEVHSLRTLANTYALRTVDLDAAIASRGLSYGNNFKIRFNQYGNDYMPWQGIAVDDLAVSANPIALTLSLPEQATENAGTISATATLPSVSTSATVIALGSSAPAKAVVPASVTIPAGELSASFNVSILDDAIADGDRTVSISATLPGSPAFGTPLRIVDDDLGTPVLSVPATASEDTSSVVGTVSLPLVPVGPVTVLLASSDPTAATVPASLVFQAGQVSQAFSISIVNDFRIDGPQITTITASVSGGGSATASLTVTDNEGTGLSVSPGSYNYEGTTWSGSVSIAGTLNTNLIVSLSSSDPSRLSVPSSVLIAAGSTNATFIVSAPDNTLNDGSQQVLVTATALGFTTATNSVYVRDNDVHHFGFTSISAAQATHVPFNVSITAFDINNSAIQTYSGSPTLTAASSGGSVTVAPSITSAFSSGYWSGPVTVGQPGSNVQITATDGVASSTSNAFNVALSPSLSLSPASVSAGVSPGATTTRTVTLRNAGGGSLTWRVGTVTTLAADIAAGPEFEGGERLQQDKDNALSPPVLNPFIAKRASASVPVNSAAIPLANILLNLNSNHGLVRGAIPNRYAFSEGVTGTSISDGGGDMYDGGNYLGTNLAPGSPIIYSDNALATVTQLGSGSSYFTRKYEGLFVFAADVSGLNYFEIFGNLGADGSGSTDSAVLTMTYAGTTYRGFVKRVYNAYDPSVNHLIIVPDNGSVTHEVATSTDNDYHRVTGLGSVTRIYYLLYAGTGGAYIDNNVTQTIMATFLDAATTPDWVVPSPLSGTLASGATQSLALNIGRTNLTAGTYTRQIVFESNDPQFPQKTLPVTLTVFAPPAIATQPVNQTVVAGSEATFSVVATGATPITYQWRRNGLEIPGATGATLTLPLVPFDGGGNFSVRVTNPGGSVLSDVATLTVDPVAPVIGGPHALTAVVGRPFVYRVIASTTRATYQATGLPAGLTIDDATGLITGIPSGVGLASVSVTATNVTGADTATLTITVQPPPPVVTSPVSASGRMGTGFDFTVVGTNSPSSFSATGLPTGLTINTTTGEINGTPTQAGTFLVQLTVTNATGTVRSSLLLAIAPPLNAPVYTGPLHFSAVQGTAFTHPLSYDNAPTNFSATALPSGISLHATTGVLSGTPDSVGVAQPSITATNGFGAVTVPLRFTVNPPPAAPVITSSSTAVAVLGVPFTFTLTAEPAAGVAFTAGVPAEFSLDSETGMITGTPTALGTIRVPVGARTNTTIGPVSELAITVNPAPDAPVLTSDPVLQGRVGASFAHTLEGTHNPTGFAITSGTLPDGLGLAADTGEITGTPTQVGRTRVWFAASNGNGSGFALEITFDIGPALAAPLITSSGSATAQVGQAFQYQVTATNGPTMYGVTPALPAGLSFAAGVISGIPAEATDEPVVLTLVASNASGNSAPKTLALSILPAAGTPVIVDEVVVRGRVGAALSHGVIATGNPTSYLAVGLPAGLTLEGSTGEISGLPREPGRFEVTVRAANSAGLGAPATLVLAIAPAEAAPVITSSASASSRVGRTLTYTATAEPLPIDSFTLSGTLPLGLVFNTSTGVLSGQPGEPGVFRLELTADGSGGTSAPQPLVLSIAPASNAPMITSPLYATGTVGADFRYQITASSVPAFPDAPFPPPFALDAVNLPEGLAVNPANGLIAGRPTMGGVYTATLVGTNSAGTGPLRDLVLSIRPSGGAPVITSASTAFAQVGEAFVYQITATSSPVTFDVLHAPAWLTVDNSSGVLAGIPTDAGRFSLQIVAANAAGTGNPQTLVLSVAPVADTPVITSSRTLTGRVGSAFSFQLVTSPAATLFTGKGLPPGLMLDETSGEITGTPTASGRFEAEIVAANANGRGRPVTLVLMIQPNLQLVVPGS